jgi:hypothetical protein
MRFVSASLGLGVVVLFSGCADTKWGFLRNSQETARIPGETPSAAQLLALLNQNAQRLQTLECRDLDLDIRSGLHQFGARGKMACQKPRNFRLVAEVLSKREADIGSNDQEFWYWIAKAEPPYLVHCSYQDLAQGVRVPFPFQPEWAMEALGMAERDPGQSYKLVPTRNTWELVQDTVNAQGQRIQKVTVFNRSNYQVRDHLLKDAAGKELCAAHVTETQNVGGASLPRKIVLSYPAERLELKMKLDDVVVNRPFEREQLSGLFSRPVLTGVQSYDLARGLDSDPGGVRRAGGVLPR